MQLTNTRQRVFVWLIVPLIGLASFLAYLSGGQGEYKFLTAAVLSVVTLVLALIGLVRSRKRH